MKKIPLRWKISLLPAALMLSLVVAVLWLGEQILEDRLWVDAEARAQQAANLLAGRLSRTLDRRVEELRLVAGLPELREPAADESVRAALDRALRFSPYFVWLGLRDAHGGLIQSTGEPPTTLLPLAASSEPGRTALRFGGVVLDPAFSASQRQGLAQSYLDLALRAAGPDRRTREVAGRIAWRNLEELRDDPRDDDPDRGVLKLVLVAGRELMMAEDVAPVWRQAIVQTDAAVAGQAASRHVVERDGEALMMVPATVPVSAGGTPLPWRVYAVQDAAGIVAPVAQWNRTVMLSGVLAAGLIGVAGYLLALRLQTPYRPFLEAIAKRVREQPAEGGRALTRHLDAITQELGASPEITSLQERATGVLDQLVEGAQRLRAVLEQIPAGVLLINPNGLLVFSNRAADDLLQLGVAHRTQSFALGFSDAQTRERLQQMFDGTLDGDEGHTAALRLNDGSSRWCQLRPARLTDSDGGRQGVLLVVQDVGREVGAEQALLRYQHELQSLAQQLLTQEKLTTARLAQALHDQLGQTLAALSLCLDAALPAGSALTAGQPAQRARELSSQAIREVRGVLIGLRPPLLDEQGLVAALDNEVALQAERHAEIDILVEHDVNPQHRWPSDVEYAAFMITREALGNALLHAEASVVRVTLQSSDSGLSVEVEDDGRGLPDGRLSVRPGHFGVVGMRERAAAIGARFEIGSTQNAGVVVRFDWRSA